MLSDKEQLIQALQNLQADLNKKTFRQGNSLPDFFVFKNITEKVNINSEYLFR